jgi:hypothetical protein
MDMHMRIKDVVCVDRAEEEGTVGRELCNVYNEALPGNDPSSGA